VVVVVIVDVDVEVVGHTIWRGRGAAGAASRDLRRSIGARFGGESGISAADYPHHHVRE
jgi:hypothetical protein